jgi:hypothetical protein
MSKVFPSINIVSPSSSRVEPGLPILQMSVRHGRTSSQTPLFPVGLSDLGRLRGPSLPVQLRAIKAQLEALQGTCAVQSRTKASEGELQSPAQVQEGPEPSEWLAAVRAFTTASSQQLTALMGDAPDGNDGPSPLSPSTMRCIT